MSRKILITLLLISTTALADDPVNLEIEREPHKLASIGDIYLTKDGWFLQRKLEEEEIIDEIIRQLKIKLQTENRSYEFQYNDASVFSIHSNGDVFFKNKKIGNDPTIFPLFYYIEKRNLEDKK